MPFVDPDEAITGDRPIGTDARGGEQSFVGEFIDPSDVIGKPVEREEVYTPIETAGQFAAGFNEVVPDILGAPVDVIDMIRSGTLRTGIFPDMSQELPQSIGSSDHLRAITDEFNITKSPETLAKKAGKYTSIGLSVLTALKGTLGKDTTKLIKDANRSVTKRVAEKVTEPLINRPGGTIAAETGGSIGAVAGGELTSSAFGEDYRMIGEFIGGGVTAPLTDLGYNFAKFSVPKIRVNLDKRMVDFEPGGIVGLGKKGYVKGKALFNAKTRASRRIAEVSEDLDSAIKNIERGQGKLTKGVIETPASKTGDKHLMALEQEVINENPALYNFVAKNSAKNQDVIRQELSSLYDEFPIEIAQREIRKSAEAQIALLDNHLMKTRDKVRMAVALLDPQTDPQTINKLSRQIIDNAAGKAKQHQKEIWSGIKNELIVGDDARKGVKQAYKSHVAEYLNDDQIPEFLKRQLGSLNKKGNLTRGNDKKIRTLGGLKKMRTDINRVVTSEVTSSNPNLDRIRVLNDFQDELLEYMRVTGDSDALDAAIAYSREYNTKFNRGVIGKIRGYDPKGGGRIDPELTLESTVGAGGPKANVIARQLSDIQEVGGEKLLDQNPADLVEDYLKSKIRIANTKGEVRVESADIFLERNQNVLKLFPKMSKQIRNAMDMENAYKTLETETRALKNAPDLKFMQKLQDKTPVDFVRTIIKTPNPQKQMAAVLSKLSPNGKKAVRGSILEFLESSARGKADDEGIRVLSGSDMKATYRQYEKAFNQALTKPQRARLIRIMNSLVENEFPKEGVPKIEGSMSNTLGKILTYPAKIYGARHGAALGGRGGASIQTAHMGSKGAESIYHSLNPDRASLLMRDMVLDEDLYKSVLKQAKAISLTQQGIQLPKIPKYSPLQGWMIAVGLDEFKENNNANDR